MTIDEFISVLKEKVNKSEAKFRVTLDGLLRADNFINDWCPLEFVAEVDSGFVAAKKLGIYVLDTIIIMRAADSPNTDPLRKRLLDACNVKEVTL